MPHFYLHGVSCNDRGLGRVYASRRPGHYDDYRDTQPILGFVDLPVTTMFHVGEVSMHQDELVAMVKSKDYNYSEFYVQSNYAGGLDLSVRVRGIGPYAVYELTMPPHLPNPTPSDWHEAIGKTFKVLNYNFALLDYPDDDAYALVFE